MPNIAYRRISGNWTALLDWYVRQGGVWRQANQVFRRVGGVWREVFRRNYYIGTITPGTFTNPGGPNFTTTTGFLSGTAGSATFQNGNPYGAAQPLYVRSTFNSTLGQTTVANRTGWAVGQAQIPGVTNINVVVCDMAENFIVEATLTWQNDPSGGGLGNAYWASGNPLGFNHVGVGSTLANGTQYKVYVQFLP